MTGVADVVAQAAQAEVDAVVAAGAAQVAVLAAESVVIAAEQQVAQVVQSASEEIQHAQNVIATHEGEVSWLKQKTQNLEAEHLSTVAMVQTLQAQILELSSSLELLSLPPSPIVETPSEAMQEVLPESADAPQVAEEKAAEAERAKKRHRLL